MSKPKTRTRGRPRHPLRQGTVNRGPSLPSVPAQHATARAAQRLLLRMLPPEWPHLAPAEGDDYGFDLTFMVTERAQVTGRVVHLQVKGIARVNSNPRVQLKVSTVSLYRSSNDASQIVVVDVENETLWHVSTDDEALAVVASKPDAVRRNRCSFQFSDIHRVSSRELRMRLERHSFRAWSRDGMRAPIGLLFQTQEIASFYAALLSSHLPQAVFISGHDSPAVQYCCSFVEGKWLISDLAFPWRTSTALIAHDSIAPCFPATLAAVLSAGGLNHLALEVLVHGRAMLNESSLADASMRELLVGHAQPAQLGAIVRPGLTRGFGWASAVVRAVVVSPRVHDFSSREIIAAFNELGPAITCSDRLKCAGVLAETGDMEATRELLATIPIECVRTEKDHYLYARVLETLGDNEAAAVHYQAAIGHGDAVLRLFVASFAMAHQSESPEARSWNAEYSLEVAGSDEPQVLRPKDEYAQSAVVVCGYLVGVSHGFGVYDPGTGEAIDALSCSDVTSSVYERVNRDGNPMEQKACTCFTLALVQAIRTGTCQWWARALGWGGCLVGATGVESLVEDQLMAAVLVLSSARHGAAALRMSAVLFAPADSPMPSGGHPLTTSRGWSELCDALDAAARLEMA